MIFTKFDALVTKTFGVLQKEGKNFEEAINGRESRALDDFQAKCLAPLKRILDMPIHEVRLRGATELYQKKSNLTDCSVDMHKKNTKCKELIEQTAHALNDDAIKLLFVSVQQNNLDICIKYAMELFCSHLLHKEN